MRTSSLDTLLTFLVCLAVGAFIWVDTLSYPPVQGQGFGQGPAFYPRVLAFSLVFLGALELLLGLRRRAVGEGEPHPGSLGGRYLPVLLLTAFSVVLVALMRYLGFFVSGFLLVFLAALLVRGELRVRYLLWDGVFGVGIILLVYVVFEVLVGIRLPRPHG